MEQRNVTLVEPQAGTSMFSILWPLKIIQALVGFAVSLIIFASCVLTITAFMGDKGFWWDLSSHFRMQYLILQGIGLLLAVVSLKLAKKPKAEVLATVVFLAFFAGLNLTQVAPYYSFKPQTAHAATQQSTVRIMHFNVLGLLNRREEDVAAAIREADPHMVDLVEYTEDWQRKLEATGVFDNYPYRVSGQAHMALYSKIPLTRKELFFVPRDLPVANTANILARFNLDGKPVSLLVAHPVSPFLPKRLATQRKSFEMWVENRNRYGENLVIVGDLNTTPWSAEFKRLTSATDLRDSQLGFGIQPSWPTFLIPLEMRGKTDAKPTRLLQPLAIPIDHVLVSANIEVHDRKVGPFVGSDHLPVLAEIGLKP